MDEKRKFVYRALAGNEVFSELCDEYGVSRKTGYKWLARYEAEGMRGLEDRSRRPGKSVNSLDEDAIIRTITLKHNHMTWGPKKLKELLNRSLGEGRAPSISSITRILKKADLIKKRRIRSALSPGRIQNRIEAKECNDVWVVDYKGWWLTRDRYKCTPLTISDRASRMLIRVQRVDKMTAEVARSVFESAFSEYGLPKVIRSDNGSPFATTNAPHGLSRLSVWWMSLGILPDRIDPGKPYQNGTHERMHRDLKAEVQMSIVMDLVQSQPALDAWREEYNEARPHEGIGMQMPAEIYVPSTRKYEPFDELEYPEGFLARKVSSDGKIKINSLRIHVSTVFAGHHLGLNPTGESSFSVWLGEFQVGNIDLLTASFIIEGVKI
ncbi:MAG TPA: integrase core domain-containing protein [Bacillota bacterium]|nr:integrase core domain-containing protein [Bacillota bacterium]